MVHITYGHGSESNEETIVILKEYHLYISDDRFHDLAYIQHCFFAITFRGRTYRWINIGFGYMVS
jgi:hypothetical protein